MGPGQTRLLIWSVPTVAILLSLLLYKRKSVKKSESGGVNKTVHENSKSEIVLSAEDSSEDEEESIPVSPNRSPYCRSLSGVDSAPIDIKTNRTPPLIISDTELDMEIEKIKSMKSFNNNIHSSSSSSSTIVESVEASEDSGKPEERNRDSANHSPAEAMLVSPSSSIASDEHHSDSDSGKGGSDVATPPPPIQQQFPRILPESRIIIHEFVIPQQLVGRLIGRHGTFVHQIKNKTNAHILIKKHPENLKGMKICSIEGTRTEIDGALEIIRDRFPEKRYPEVTLEHVNFADTINTVSLIPDCMHLKLVEGINNDTIISCLVTPRHLFLQQPTHPTFPSLNILSSYMNACYSTESTESTPLLPTPIQENTICAAYSLDAWYRAIVISSDEDSKNCYIRFLDYGGYATVETSLLRQIRGDFLLLPFQAAECMLAGVEPLSVSTEDESEVWSPEAFDLVTDLTKGAIVFTQIVDYLDDCTPLVNIYIRGPEHVIFLNKELVNRGLARWQEIV